MLDIACTAVFDGIFSLPFSDAHFPEYLANSTLSLALYCVHMVVGVCHVCHAWYSVHFYGNANLHKNMLLIYA